MSNVVQLNKRSNRLLNVSQIDLFNGGKDDAPTMAIGDHDLIVREYRGERVVTFDVINKLHNKIGASQRNFSSNKKHFVEGVDYYFFKGLNGRQTLCDGSYNNSSELPKNANFAFYLFTQTGYLMLAKSFNDELAWQVQRELINGYFMNKNQEKAPENLFGVMRLMINALEESQKMVQETALKLEVANEKIVELDERTSITIHPTWKQAHHIAREMGILSTSGIAHSSVISAIAKQLKLKANTRAWGEDDYVAVVAKQEGTVTAWEVYYKPAGIQSIMNWWTVNKDRAYFEERYKNNTKTHAAGDLRTSGYKIGSIKYIIKTA